MPRKTAACAPAAHPLPACALWGGERAEKAGSFFCAALGIGRLAQPVLPSEGRSQPAPPGSPVAEPRSRGSRALPAAQRVWQALHPCCVSWALSSVLPTQTPAPLPRLPSPRRLLVASPDPPAPPLQVPCAPSHSHALPRDAAHGPAGSAGQDLAGREREPPSHLGRTPRAPRPELQEPLCLVSGRGRVWGASGSLWTERARGAGGKWTRAQESTEGRGRRPGRVDSTQWVPERSPVV